MDAPFRVAETHGPMPFAHDLLDELRMNWRRTPEAEYPDGYLGTINPRRGDRLMDGLKRRQNSNRPTARGIHKGERIDSIDYFWPEEFNLWSGLENQMTGLRWAPPGIGQYLPDERYPTDGHVGPRSVPVGSRYAQGGGPIASQDPDRVSVSRSQAPGWSSGGTRGNPGMAVPYAGR